MVKAADKEQKRLEELFETLRERLLDLSKRNRMLNYKITEKSRNQLRIVDEVLENEGGCFELYGLLRCVRMLRGRKTWSRDCETLRDEIVTFTRDHTGISGARSEIQFSLA